jgi:hypothetical protein
MNGGAGLVILALVLIGIPGFFGVRAVARHRGGPRKPKPGGDIVSGWFAHRRSLREKQVDQENHAARAQAQHRYRVRELWERERARARRGAATVPGAATWTDGAAPAGASAAEPPGPRWNPLRPLSVRLRPASGRGAPDAGPGGAGRPSPAREETAAAPGDPSGAVHIVGWTADFLARARVRAPRALCGAVLTGEPPPGAPLCPRCAEASPRAAARAAGKYPEFQDGGQGFGPVPPRSPEPPPRGGEGDPAQAPSRPAAGQSATPTLEGVVVTTPALNDASAEAVPGVAQVVEGLRLIAGHAMAGNIQAKRRAVLALVYVARRCAATALTLARFMGEPGRHYGMEVTERVGAMAMHFTGAASAGTEADASLYTLLHASVAESMASGRQMPHHDELQETGGY